MVNRIKNTLSSKLGKTMFMTAVLAFAMSVSVFAAEPSTTDAMSTAFETIKTDMLSGIAVVAPIGLAITGAVLIWKFGVRFFKSMAK